MNKYVLVLLLVTCFAACEKPAEPTFQSMKNVKIANIKGDVVTLTADALFHNPNIFGVTLTGVDLDVSVDDKKAGNVTQTHSIDVPAKNDFSVPVAIDIALSDVSKNILGTVMSVLGSKKIKVHYKGFVTVKALEIDLKIPVESEQEVPLGKSLGL